MFAVVGGMLCKSDKPFIIIVIAIIIIMIIIIHLIIIIPVIIVTVAPHSLGWPVMECANSSSLTVAGIIKLAGCMTQPPDSEPPQEISCWSGRWRWWRTTAEAHQLPQAGIAKGFQLCPLCLREGP